MQPAAEPARGEGEGPPPTPPSVPPRRVPTYGLLAAGAGVLLVLVAVAIWRSRPDLPPGETTPPDATPGTSPLELSGRWQAQVPLRLPSRPPRPALKDFFLETDAEGNILAAGVILTDPGRGGAGAGYRVVPDGQQRLQSVLARIAEKPSGAAVPIDFIPFPAWVPQRERLWRVLEGSSRRPEQVRYLLLESVEDDYLVQAGINETGFLSWVFFSRPYASDRGVDALSPVIRPEPGSSLRGFENIIWDFSGAADFLVLEVHATVSQPDGVRLRVTLKR
ncbi:MAG: hypothetical protein ABR576_13740 [Thermoanaerobaculia bacterium]